MPSKNKQYNLVQSDDLDTRIPLMPEEAFQHGIPFNCKFIGSMDIPRPTSRVEIVAAMRRVRVEFKSKGVKKKKVTVTVSVDGIKTTLRKKNRKRKKRNNASAYVDVDGGNSMVVLSHPIYRIFYVSHDSQDVKIFSYIARETSSNVFHCCVFKAANKTQAMRIVRTVGQAFEVCHKLVGTAGEEDESEEVQESDTNLSSQLDSKLTEGSASSSQPPEQQKAIVVSVPEPVVANSNNNNNNGSATSLVGDKAGSTSSNTSTPPAILASALINPISSSSEIIVGEILPTTSNNKVSNKPQNLDLTKRDLVSSTDLMNLTTPSSSAVPTPTQTHSFFKEINTVLPNTSAMMGKSTKGDMVVVTNNANSGNKENLSQAHEAQLLKEQLEQQTQNTRAALAQIQLLRDQLAAESAARIEAQARTHQLLIHNKELLDHLQTLVRHIQELEAVASAAGIGKDRTSGSSNSIAAATAAGVTLPQLTPRSKIERWFSFVVPPTSPDGNNDDDDYSAADFESLDKAIRNLRLSRRTLLSNKESGFVSETNELTESIRKPPRGTSNNNKRKTSKNNNNQQQQHRAITIRPAQYYRHNSSNTTTNHHHHHRHNGHNGNRLSSTSSWLRRVLRLKRSTSAEYSRKLKHDMDFYNHDAHSTSTRKRSNQHSPSLHRVNSIKSRVSSL